MKTILNIETNEYSNECCLGGMELNGYKTLAQCCCDCIHQAEVMKNCTMFRDFDKEGCVCDQSLGFYICTVKNYNIEDMGYGKVDIIPQHHIGCELYISKSTRTEE